MSENAISAKGLGKEYIIGHQKSGDLRNSFANRFKNLVGKNQEHESFWALKDIDFEIKKGEAVGIIGRNGAGKSTLLKILSRITEPTTGRFEINGRVSSLLEVGTGFHPELSGRENIYLNGTILGMNRGEIRAKFDEIVEFSGVSKFLDTPVKHYSSGMKVRLAFSVAAHLEPEILIVDEVLAVGDAEFQKKCLGKMDDVSKNEGRTIVFVSHNMGSLLKLCDKGILLGFGQIQSEGTIENIVKDYLPETEVNNRYRGEGLINGVQLLNQDSESNSVFYVQSHMKIIVDLNLKDAIFSPNIGLIIKDKDGNALIGFNNLHYPEQPAIGKIIGRSAIEINIPKLPLSEGTYGFDIFVSEGIETLESIKDQIFFKIVDDRTLDLKLNPALNKIIIEGVRWKIIK